MDIDRIKRAQRNRCAICRSKLKEFQVDHIVPIAKGGDSNPANIQLLCKDCNLKKGSRDAVEFMQSLGRLL